MFWSLIATLQLVASVLSLNPPFLDCNNIFAQYSNLRKCCTHDLMPNGCECFDVAFNTEFTNAFQLLPKCPDEVSITFSFYDRQHNSTGIPIHGGSFPNIGCTPFDNTRKTFIFIHGWGSNVNFPYVTGIRDEILSAFDMNVILVDWSDAMSPDSIFQSVPNARVVGAMLGRLVQDLHVHGGASLEDIHLAAFGSASHIAGSAGKEIERLTNSKVGRITALDPTGYLYEDFSANVRLDSSDALFVDVIHTDSSPAYSLGAGMESAVGHVDFYPNNGKVQPGCPGHKDTPWISDFLDNPSVASLCSHFRATDFFKNSISQCRYDPPNMDGAKCTMGYHVDPSCKGTYRFKTTSTDPYC